MTKARTRVAVLIIAVVSFIIVILGIPAMNMATDAANTVTSIGLAEHGMKAYDDGWIYVYGGKGESYSGTRKSDCAGLITSYFSDNGVSGVSGGVNTLLRTAGVIRSGDVAATPRIHGLVVTISNNDHIGIYVGNNTVTDNSEPGVNMRKLPLLDSNGNAVRGWLKWHLIDGGLKYAWNGFYSFYGNMYYYVDGQYAVNTTVTDGGSTYNIGSDGIVRDSSGNAIPVDNSMKNSGYVSASQFTNTVIGGGSNVVPEGQAATVNADSVRMRSSANTTSGVVTTLSKGSTVYVTETVTGTSITDSGKTTDKWYKCSTASGSTGYICSLYVTLSETPQTQTGTINVSSVRMRADSNTNSNIVTTLTKNTKVTILDTVTGQSITDDGVSSTKWYKCQTGSYTGYISSLYITIDGETAPAPSPSPDPAKAPSTPSISYSGDKISIICSTSDATIYYTIDSSVPTKNSIKYNGSFTPSKPATYRAIAVNSAGSSNTATLSVMSNGSVFTDVASNQWFFTKIDDAVSAGIMAGNGNNTMKPNSNITRAEFVAILCNLSGADMTNYPTKTTFTDVPENKWYSKQIAWAYNNGIVSGYSDTKFGPNDNITRQDMCVIVANFTGISKSENSTLFSDNDSIKKYAVNAVYACRDNGIVSGKGNNKFDPRANTTRAEAAAVALKCK